MRNRKPSAASEAKAARSAGGGNDTTNNNQILLQAQRAAIRRLRRSHRYDVPYLAGYSRDGTCIYLDRRLPRKLHDGGRTIDVWAFVILHETIEKALVDQLKLAYQDAHQIAQRVEQAVVRAAGFSWRKYERFLLKQVERVSENPQPRLPPDLDLKP